MDELKNDSNEPLHALLGRARRYCAEAEQCEHAVRQKLVTWGATPSEADRVVEALYNEEYINDERYARAYCESKILRQHWGRQKVLYQLRLKRLPRTAIDQGLASVDDEAYRAVLADVADKKRAELQPRFADDPDALRNKLTAFLVSRGFSLSEIAQTLDEK